MLCPSAVEYLLSTKSPGPLVIYTSDVLWKTYLQSAEIREFYQALVFQCGRVVETL